MSETLDRARPRPRTLPPAPRRLPWALFTFLLVAACARPALAEPAFVSPFTPYPTGHYPYCVAAGDLDGDGRQDLVVAETISGVLGVRLGRPDGTLGPEADYQTAARTSSSPRRSAGPSASCSAAATARWRHAWTTPRPRTRSGWRWGT